MRVLWSGPDGLVRPQGPSRARSVVRVHADIPGAGGAAPRLPQLRQGEEGAARLSGGQSALHQALRLLCRATLPAASIADVAKELALDWHTVKALEMQYMEAQLARVGRPAPLVIGIDEIAIRKGHIYRIVVSDLRRGRPIWFGGDDRSEASMAQFYAWLGARKSARIRLAVMDMWKPFRMATQAHAPQEGGVAHLEPLGSGCRIRKGEQRHDDCYHAFTVRARAQP